MNIGLFTDTYFPQINGVGTSTFTLAKQLRSLGHNVYIFTPADPVLSEEQYEKDVIRMPSIPFVFIHSFRVGIVYPPHVLIKIRKLNLDIIHTQTEFSLGMLGKTFSKAFGIPMVHTYHTMYEDYVHYIVNGHLITTSMAHTFSKVFCNFALHVIAPTQKVMSSLYDYGVTKKISVIPTGINIEKFRKSNYNASDTLKLKKSLGLEEHHKVILFVGRVAREKSIDIILDGLPAVFEKNESARFLVIGDGPHKETLEKYALSLGISHKVIFAGAKPWTEIGSYYQVGDIFVSASVSETQGLTFVEAMASGLPVIAKKDPCIEGVIEDEENGLVFENDEDISSKILELLEDNKKYSIISKKASEFSETLSEETFGKSIETLYKDVVSSHAQLKGAAKNSDDFAPKPHPAKINIIKRIATYEIIQIKRARIKIKDIASTPAKVVRKYVSEKTDNGGEKDDF